MRPIWGHQDPGGPHVVPMSYMGCAYIMGHVTCYIFPNHCRQHIHSFKRAERDWFLIYGWARSQLMREDATCNVVSNRMIPCSAVGTEWAMGVILLTPISPQFQFDGHFSSQQPHSWLWYRYSSYTCHDTTAVVPCVKFVAIGPFEFV